MIESLLELKLSQILGPAVAAASAPVAVSSVLVNARWKEREHSTAARDDFQRTVESLVDLRQERARVRRELSDDWGLSRYATTRVALNEKRELLIAKAASCWRSIVSTSRTSATSWSAARSTMPGGRRRRSSSTAAR